MDQETITAYCAGEIITGYWMNGRAVFPYAFPEETTIVGVYVYEQEDSETTNEPTAQGQSEFCENAAQSTDSCAEK